MRGSFSFIKSRNRYESSKGNVAVSLEPLEAWSHRWWQFVKKVNGLVIFNSYGYSQSTKQHQNKVQWFLEDHGIKIDLIVEVRDGLQKDNWIEEAIRHDESEREEIKVKMEKGKPSSSAGQSRRDRDKMLYSRINALKAIKDEIEKGQKVA